MGTLLNFSTAARPYRPKRSEIPLGSADILVFPGVRIERHTVDLATRIRKVAKDTGSNPQPEA
ncbi:hypothetical protein [Breoghania sp.]|uniref:hypothetical protein n=1 Tax=Breoghania sp. TaxID=2065378 RepID=UPI0029CA140A|nr:hypothetical protein [Breoghania sp.]